MAATVGVPKLGWSRVEVPELESRETNFKVPLQTQNIEQTLVHKSFTINSKGQSLLPTPKILSFWLTNLPTSATSFQREGGSKRFRKKKNQEEFNT